MITTAYGLPVDFAIAPADTDDREVLSLLCERGTYPIILAGKRYICETLETDLHQTYNVCLLPTRRKNQKTQYRSHFDSCRVKNGVGLRQRLVNSLISFRFHEYAHGRTGFRTRLHDTFGGLTLGVFLNKRLGQKLMALKDAVYA